MRHVVILAAGSRGHVDPCTGLGVRLRQAGYRVTMAVDRAFEGLVAGAGLEVRVLPGDMRSCAAGAAGRGRSDGMLSRDRIEAARRLRTYVRQVNVGVGPLLDDADVLLVGELGGAGYHVAEARDIPCIGVHVAPTRLPAGGDPHRRPRVDGHSSAERMYFEGINDLRAQYGLPPTTADQVLREQHARRWPLCFGFSPRVVPLPPTWHENMEIVGYLWPYRRPGWTPPAELVRFLDEGPPPVFVGFGSMVPTDAREVSRVVTTALHRTGQRAVVQPGWAGLTVRHDNVLTVGDIPYDWLFPRMSVVVHAAGAGVTAAGLRAGVPAIPVPHTSPDQPFWVERLMALGVSPTGSLRLDTLTADDLAEAIQAVLTDPGYRKRAAALAEEIGAEDGAGQVVRILRRRGIAPW